MFVHHAAQPARIDAVIACQLLGKTHPLPAAISLAQARDFERLLYRDNVGQADDGIIAQRGRPAMRGFHLEASVTHLSLAAIAVLFDYDPAVIAIIDEAQFRCRPVTIARDAKASLSMRLADDQLGDLSSPSVD